MEIWKDIENYEGMYQVSNEGNVKSLAREIEWRGSIRHQPERLLKPRTDRHGYLCVILCKDNNRKALLVHRLVANAFIDNPDNLPQVNHKNEDKTNNRVENLEWCTCKQNINHGTRNQRCSEANTNHIVLSIPIDMLTKQGELIHTLPSAHEAERWLHANGFPKASNTAIIQCCKGKRKSSYGFKWQYAQKS